VDPDRATELNQAIRVLCLRHRARASQLLAPLGLHAGQEALLLELDRSGPQIQAQLSDALGCEAPSVTLMARKLEALGHIRRATDPTDKRAAVVTLTSSGRTLVTKIRQLWVELAEETARGIPPKTLERLPAVLQTMSTNVDGRATTTPPKLTGDAKD